jgi:hypothetical protein
MRRYFREYGQIRAGVADMKLYLVIRTDDELRAQVEGFTPIDDALSDEEVKRVYGVTTIYCVGNAKETVN